ncbi:MAG: hypothetical protein M0Z96_09050 [Actinomycetota bacterium]|nr:hypothetical protein [Actinomycetota bacterium]
MTLDRDRAVVAEGPPRVVCYLPHVTVGIGEPSGGTPLVGRLVTSFPVAVHVNCVGACENSLYVFEETCGTV